MWNTVLFVKLIVPRLVKQVLHFVRAMAHLVEALRYNRSASIPRWSHWNFSLTSSFRPHSDPGIGSACNGNEYQVNSSWWVKAAGAKGWQPYHLHVPIAWKSGSLSLLEPSGPLQGLLYPYPHHSYVPLKCVVWTNRQRSELWSQAVGLTPKLSLLLYHNPTHLAILFQLSQHISLCCTCNVSCLLPSWLCSDHLFNC
jgi:hypothetical protein